MASPIQSPRGIQKPFNMMSGSTAESLHCCRTNSLNGLPAYGMAEGSHSLLQHYPLSCQQDLFWLRAAYDLIRIRTSPKNRVVSISGCYTLPMTKAQPRVCVIGAGSSG